MVIYALNILKSI